MCKYIEAYRTQDGTWDEVREQRVFKAVSDKLAVQSRPRPRYLLVAGAGIAVAVAAALVVGIGLPGSTPEAKPTVNGAVPTVLTGVSETPEPPPGQGDTSILTLGDVGEVTLSAGADVSIVEKSDVLVLLEQVDGRAHYDIVHREGRVVQIGVSGIVVTVVGTSFWITIDDPVVHIEVGKGVVRVASGEQVIRLEATEALSVAIPQASTAPATHRKRPLIRPRRAPRRDTRVSTKMLFEQVDDARRRGDLAGAVQLLRRIVAEKKSAASVAGAEFTLGKVERARGNHGASARAFSRCARKLPRGALGEDALAEAAVSWRAAGNFDKSRMTAHLYLERFPDGLYAAKMKRLIDD